MDGEGIRRDLEAAGRSEDGQQQEGVGIVGSGEAAGDRELGSGGRSGGYGHWAVVQQEAEEGEFGLDDGYYGMLTPYGFRGYSAMVYMVL